MPVSFGPSDVINPRGNPFVGPVPESFWLAKALLFDFDWIMAEIRNPHYHKEDYPDATPLDALKNCLITLRSYEICVGLTSNRNNREIVSELVRLNLSENFDNIRCKDDVKEIKPAPEMHVLSMDMLGVKPWRAIAFETTLVGVRAAKTAGIFCVGMPPEANREADMKLESFLNFPLLQLLEIIDKLKREQLGLKF